MKFILFLVLSFSTHLYGNPKLIIGLFEASPFAYRDNNGEIVGVTKKLADKLFLKDFQVEFVLMPYVRIIEEIRKGKIDIAIMYPNLQILQFATAVGETLGNENLVISLKNEMSDSVKKSLDLKGKTVAVMKGASYGKELNLDSVKKLEILNYKQSLELLLSKRVDAIVISSAAWKYYVKQMDLDIGLFHSVYINFVQNTIFARKGLANDIIKRIYQINENLLKIYPKKSLDILL